MKMSMCKRAWRDRVTVSVSSEYGQAFGIYVSEDTKVDQRFLRGDQARLFPQLPCGGLSRALSGLHATGDHMPVPALFGRSVHDEHLRSAVPRDEDGHFRTGAHGYEHKDANWNHRALVARSRIRPI